VPLIVIEARSAACRRVLRDDNEIVAWMFTEAEILSAIHRTQPTKQHDDDPIAKAERRVERFLRSWELVVDATGVQREVRDVIRTHSLRAGDAMQLAAARLWARGYPKGRGFISADRLLARAAASDGFDVLDLSRA